MKLFTITCLGLSIISASAQSNSTDDNNEVINDISCFDLCKLAALGDSVKQSRCAIEDIACLCGDKGWSDSLETCSMEICPPAALDGVYYLLSSACQQAGVPLTDMPAASTGTGTTPTTSASYDYASIFPIPEPIKTASAFSSAMSAAYSVYLGTTFATDPDVQPTTAASSGSSSAVAAMTASSGSSSAVATAASSAAATPSSTSGARILGPSSYLVAGLVGLAVMGYAAV